MTSPATDFSPLSREPAPADVERLRAAVARGDYGSTAQKAPRGSSVATFAGWLVGGFLGLVFGGVTVAAAVRGDRDDVVIGLWFVAGCVVLGVAVTLLVRVQERRHERRTVRLAAFAEVNGLEFRPSARTPKLPGVPRPGDHTSTTHQMRWAVGDTPVQMASYHRSSGGSAPNSTQCRYLAVQLGVAMPALSFHCGRKVPTRAPRRGGPDTFDGRPYSLRADQHSVVEGATALFDDRVVALLTDPAHPCDAEYVNGWFLAYYHPRADDDENLWRHVRALAEAVAARKPVLTSRT